MRKSNQPTASKTSKEFKELKKKWDKALKEAGFDDVEFIDGKFTDRLDYRNFKDSASEFLRKKDETEEWIRVLEINAYNNKELPFLTRRMLQRHLDTLGDKEKHKKFIKKLSNPDFMYIWLSRNKKKLIEFAQQFNNQTDNWCILCSKEIPPAEYEHLDCYKNHCIDCGYFHYKEPEKKNKLEKSSKKLKAI